VAQKQALLLKYGFHVAQDGVAGPQTSTAWNAFIKGIHGNAWNEAWSKNHNARTPAPTPPHDTTGVNPPGTTPPPGRTPAGTTPSPDGTDIFDLSGMEHMINPEASAHAAANAQYDPQINTLTRAQAAAAVQQKADQGNLASWYKSLIGETGDAHDSDLADYQALMGTAGDVTKGAVDSLGGSASAAAAQAGALGQIGSNELGGISLANLGDMNARKVNYGKEGVGQRILSRQAFDTATRDNAGKVADLQGAKGNAFVGDRDAAYNTLASQQKNLMNAKIAQALAGPQLKAAELGNKATQQNIDINAWRQKMGIKLAAQGGNAGSVPEFTKQNPGDLTKLGYTLLQGSLGPKGNFNASPVDIYQKMSATLSSLSYGKWDPSVNPAAKAFLISTVNAHLAAWNRQNPQNKFAIKGGAIVHTK
jgi:hypothetical protein